ncbi:MAG: hypothetical protein GTO02_09810 [Candidatus Dadabacteria bacterium]|nr:hypothetical protein [Candidatus Dadabacteria bacterium]
MKFKFDDKNYGIISIDVLCENEDKDSFERTVRKMREMRREQRIESLCGALQDYSDQYYNNDPNEPLLLDIYTTFVEHTRLYPIENDLEHSKNGLIAEVGEVAGVYAKYARGDFDELELKNRLAKELGDVFYYLMKICKINGFDPYDIILGNMDKLVNRFREDTVKGDGDDR